MRLAAHADVFVDRHRALNPTNVSRLPMTPEMVRVRSDGHRSGYASGARYLRGTGAGEKMRTLTTVAELRHALGPAAGGLDDRARPDDGRAARRPPRARSRRRGWSAISSSRASSSTRPSSRSRATSTPTRPISRPISRGPRRPASTSSSPPPPRSSIRPGSRPGSSPRARPPASKARPGPATFAASRPPA